MLLCFILVLTVAPWLNVETTRKLGREESPLEGFGKFREVINSLEFEEGFEVFRQDKIMGDVSSQPTKIWSEDRVYKKLSRKRRALNFPSGTSIQFGVCYFPFVVGTHGLFNFGITLGSNWEVPEHVHKYKYPAPDNIRSRKERRSLFPKIESLLTRLGMQGEYRVLHVLCQLSKRRGHPGSSAQPSSFLQALLTTLLHYPASHQPMEPHDRYDTAAVAEDCETIERLLS